MEQIPCLSICQPWPWMILRGWKRIENRTWWTNYRGPLAIHASRSKTWLHAVEPLRRAGFPVPPTPAEAADGPSLFGDGFAGLAPLPFGCVVGVVELEEVLSYGDNPSLADDPFASGPYCWRVSQPRELLEPVPQRGRASLFRVDRSLVGSLLGDAVS